MTTLRQIGNQVLQNKQDYVLINKETNEELKRDQKRWVVELAQSILNSELGLKRNCVKKYKIIRKDKLAYQGENK